jgi:GNAT superfamily N-acetyltransferase
MNTPDLSAAPRVSRISTTVIRDATTDDIPRLMEMGARFVAETVYRERLVIDEDALTRTFRMLITADSGTLFVSVAGDTVTGMIGLFVFEHPFTGELAAHELFWWVEPEYRGHGLKLLKCAEAWAAGAGAKHVHMVAPSPEVGRLYERLGYGYLEAGYQKAIDAGL